MGSLLHNFDGAFIVLTTSRIPVCNLLLPLHIRNGPQMLPFVFKNTGNFYYVIGLGDIEMDEVKIPILIVLLKEKKT